MWTDEQFKKLQELGIALINKMRPENGGWLYERLDEGWLPEGWVHETYSKDDGRDNFELYERLVEAEKPDDHQTWCVCLEEDWGDSLYVSAPSFEELVEFLEDELDKLTGI